MVLLILSQIECNAVRSGGVNKQTKYEFETESKVRERDVHLFIHLFVCLIIFYTIRSSLNVFLED